MERKSIILDFIKNGDMQGFRGWAETFPLIEQPDIIREFKEVMQDIAKETGMKIPTEATERLDKATDNYEESILNEQLASLKVDLIKKQKEEVLERIIQNADGLREYIKHSMETNAPDARDMYILALKLIDVEKKANVYHADNWWWFEQ
jgi:hypothetical protein